MQKIIIRFFLCLLIHPSILLMELIVRGIDGDFMTGGLHPSTIKTETAMSILMSAGLLGAALILGLMGTVIWTKSRVAAIIIAPLLAFASIPFFLFEWVIYSCSTMGECF